MSRRTEVCAASQLTPGSVTGAGPYAVGKIGGELFAVTRRCRHLGADLAKGSIDRSGCLVCPWHGARYNVGTGRMVSGPRGVFARIPGVDAFYRALSSVFPLGRGKVVEEEGTIYVQRARARQHSAYDASRTKRLAGPSRAKVALPPPTPESS